MRPAVSPLVCATRSASEWYNPLMASRENIPVHLAWFLLRIRKHSGEDDFFEKRFADMGEERMLIEVQMVGQLFERGLILLPEKKTCKKAFSQPAFSAGRGITVTRRSTEHIVEYWNAFALTPAGKYAVVETLFQLVGGVAKTLVVALIGAAAALLIHG